MTDLDPLLPEPKLIPSEAVQLPNESRRFWTHVTSAIISKDFNEATRLKQEIEDRQRKKAAERKEANRDWTPRFFAGAVTPVGRPELTDDGKIAIQRLQENDYSLNENREYAA